MPTAQAQGNVSARLSELPAPGERVPARGRGWNWMIFEVPSNPDHSGSLRFSDFAEALFLQLVSSQCLTSNESGFNLAGWGWGETWCWLWLSFPLTCNLLPQLFSLWKVRLPPQHPVGLGEVAHLNWVVPLVLGCKSLVFALLGWWRWLWSQNHHGIVEWLERTLNII